MLSLGCLQADLLLVGHRICPYMVIHLTIRGRDRSLLSDATLLPMRPCTTRTAPYPYFREQALICSRFYQRQLRARLSEKSKIALPSSASCSLPSHLCQYQRAQAPYLKPANCRRNQLYCPHGKRDLNQTFAELSFRSGRDLQLYSKVCGLLPASTKSPTYDPYRQHLCCAGQDGRVAARLA